MLPKIKYLVAKLSYTPAFGASINCWENYKPPRWTGFARLIVGKVPGKFGQVDLENFWGCCEPVPVRGARALVRNQWYY